MNMTETEAKTEFINTYTKIAKTEFEYKYNPN